MRIDKDSYGTLAIVYAICLAVVALMLLFCHNPYVKYPVLLFCLVFAGWQTAFFRIPVRQKCGSSTLVSSVADGKVVILQNEYEKEFLKCDTRKISVFMDFFDVHANYWPVSGVVTYYKYHPGKHFLAFLPKASEDNEHSCICIRTDEGKDVFFKQLAGTFARRIVCYAKVGDRVVAGEQCGIIKFGSRIDMYLPLDAKINVALGEQTRACETIMAEI